MGEFPKRFLTGNMLFSRPFLFIFLSLSVSSAELWENTEEISCSYKGTTKIATCDFKTEYTGTTITSEYAKCTIDWPKAKPLSKNHQTKFTIGTLETGIFEVTYTFKLIKKKKKDPSTTTTK